MQSIIHVNFLHSLAAKISLEAITSLNQKLKPFVPSSTLSLVAHECTFLSKLLDSKSSSHTSLSQSTLQVMQGSWHWLHRPHKLSPPEATQLVKQVHSMVLNVELLSITLTHKDAFHLLSQSDYHEAAAPDLISQKTNFKPLWQNHSELSWYSQETLLRHLKMF